MADFRAFVEATFRPKINILVLDVFFDDPSGETQRVSIENIADIIPDSWLYLAYKAEEISTNQSIEGLVRLLYSADEELFEIVWFPLPNSTLARLFVDMAKDAFSAAMQQSLSV